MQTLLPSSCPTADPAPRRSALKDFLRTLLHPTIKSSKITLPTDALLTLHSPRGLKIHARVGTIWITQTGDELDHLLRPGEHWLTRSPAKIVVQAVDHAELILRPL